MLMPFRYTISNYWTVDIYSIHCSTVTIYMVFLQAYMKYDSVANGPPNIPTDGNDVEANQGTV